jgi:hypothetical protein
MNVTHASPDLETRLSTLLERSMTAWGLLAKVTLDEAGVIAILSPGHDVKVARAAPGAPFRWMVSVNARKRPAVSILAVLRQVRQALDPGYATSRVRIAPMAVSVPR